MIPLPDVYWILVYAMLEQLMKLVANEEDSEENSIPLICVKLFGSLYTRGVLVKRDLESE